MRMQAGGRRSLQIAESVRLCREKRIVQETPVGSERSKNPGYRSEEIETKTTRKAHPGKAMPEIAMNQFAIARAVNAPTGSYSDQAPVSSPTAR
jgi:hypothetical protein